METAPFKTSRGYEYDIILMYFNNRQLQNLIRSIGEKPTVSINANMAIIRRNRHRFNFFVGMEAKK